MSRNTAKWLANLKQIDGKAFKKASRNFRVVRNGKYFRLMHVPSGDYVQRNLSDFLTQKDAYLCRTQIIEAVPEWDWSDTSLFQEMPTDIFDKVWAALYAPRCSFTHSRTECDPVPEECSEEHDKPVCPVCHGADKYCAICDGKSKQV